MPTIQPSGVHSFQASQNELKLQARVDELENKVKTLESKSLSKDAFKSSVAQSKDTPILKIATKAGAKSGAMLMGAGFAGAFALEAATYSAHKLIEVPGSALIGGAMGTVGGGITGAVSGALIGSITGSLIDSPTTAAVAGGVVGGVAGLLTSGGSSSPIQKMQIVFGAVTGASASYAVSSARQDNETP